MTQRIRNLNTILGATLPASEQEAVEKFAGLNMSSYKSVAQSSTVTALANDNDIWVELPSGPSAFTIYLPVTVTAANNIQVALVADQGLTATGIIATAMFTLDGVAPSTVRINALGGAASGGTTNAWTGIQISGTINVTNPGVLQLRWAQVAAGTASQILAGASIDTVQLTP